MKAKSNVSVFERTLSWLLSVVMVFGVIFLTPIMNVEAITQSEFDSKLNSLRSKYPNYSTWNDYFDGGHQCWGFARLIAYNVFGEHADNWSKSTNINDVKAGDVLQYGNTSGSGHTVFVTSVSGNTITFVDCNGNGNYSNGSKVRSCGVKWDNTISKSGSMFNKYSFAYRLVAPNLGSNPNPFPGDEDTSYAVPVSLKAKYKDNTYDGNGNVESNRWIDAGDDCYIEKVYTNGFCHVEYPAGNTRRWAYAKATLFDIPKKQVTPQGHVMSESEAAGQTIPDGDYYIVSEISQDYFIDIPGDDFKTTSGKNVEMWIWSSLMPNKDGYDCFHVEYLNNGFYRISQINTNMCLDVNGASLSRGENVQMWEKNTSNAQQWSIEKTSHGYRLRARCNAYYLDVYNGDHKGGTNLRCWEGNDSKAQSFGFIPRNLNEQPIADGVYTIKTNVNRECYLDVYGNPGEFKAGSNIQLYKFNNATVAEKYTIKYAGDGWYKISEKTSGLLIEISDPNSGFLTNSRNIQVFSDNGGKHQLWKIRKNSDGTYFIINKASGYYLDLEGSKTDNGTNVSQYPYNGNSNQRWVIELETYTISYNMNGGSGSIGNQIKTYNQDLTLSSAKPTRTGYDFVSWNTKSDGTGTNYNPNGKYTANSGATLYAIWKAKQVTVTFYRNQNSSDNTTATQTFTYGASNQSFSNKNWSKDGHTLLGWSENRNATDKQYSTNSGVDPNWIVQKSPNVTIYAVWKANTYTVSYNMNGGSGSISDQIKTYGQDLTLSSTKPTRTGYDFVSWNTKSDGTGTNYNPNDKYKANSGATLYATWRKIDENLGTYKYANPNKTTLYARISYNGTDKYLTNLSDNASNDKSYKNVQLKTKNDTVQQVWEFEKLSDGGYKISSVYDGRILDIYNTKTDNGTNIGACGTYYANGGQIWYLIKKDGKYVIQPKVSTGVYLGVANSNDGGNVQVTTSSHLFNIEILKPVGTSSMKAVQEGTSTSPTKFTWTAATDATWYNLYIYDGEVWKSNCIYSQKNIKALEWSVQLKPGTYQAHLSPINVHNWTNSNIVSFTVKENKYTMSFNANGGTGTMATQNLIFGEKFSIPENKFTKIGYEFCYFNVYRKSDGKWYTSDGHGWQTQSEIDRLGYTKRQYPIGENHTMDNNWTTGAASDLSFEFYAVWKTATYTVSYNMNGGSGSIGNQIKTYGQDLTLSSTIPIKTGCIFLGWNTDKNAATAQYQAGSKYTANSGTTLYAVWKAIDYNAVPTVKGNFDGHTYEYYSQSMNWDQAYKFCEKKGGHLVTISSKAENDFVVELTKDSNDSLWIGGKTQDYKTWFWITGEPFDYENWSEGEPNNYGGNQSVIKLYRSGKWDDDGSSYSHGFICEYDNKIDSSKYEPVHKENYNGHEYWFFENAVDWQTAEKICEAKGGYLAIPNNADENAFILSGIQKTSRDETWIGITDIAQEGVWKDVKGNSISYTNWSGGQPDNYQDREDYAHLYDNGKWNDEKSYRAMYCSVGFVCEFDDLCTGSGHKYTEKVIAPTTSEQGYTLHICSVCGSSYKDNYKDKLSVKDYIPGDINNDGVVNNKDFSRLFQYLSGWDVVVNEAALDVNGDGSVNNKDATRLFQYVSGWSVTVY